MFMKFLFVLVNIKLKLVERQVPIIGISAWDIIKNNYY